VSPNGHFGRRTEVSETLRTYLKVETLRTGALLLFTARSARACLILQRVGVSLSSTVKVN